MYGLKGEDFDDVSKHLEIIAKPLSPESVLNGFLKRNPSISKLFEIILLISALIKDLKASLIDDSGKFIRFRWYHISKTIKAIKIIAKFIKDVQKIIKS